MDFDRNPRLAYTATVQVKVYVETEPGRGAPSYDPPYDYVVVREAELIDFKPEAHQAAAFYLLDFEGADDFDPDELVLDEVKSAASYGLEIEDIYGPSTDQKEETNGYL